ncbi:SCO1860 family LAETG-anchored protein [Streptomyces goshikiensis]|uniref:SCO1860 family LAETG-anchored protein n=1 Tax=Streptomyces goshikiensis TaxID=1942 RepID=UPI00366817F8
MNSNAFRMPAAALLATGAVALLTAPPAFATGGGPTGREGKAGAVVLRANLDVGLLDKTVHVPLKTELNEVSAPETAGKTALTVTLDGVEDGSAVSVLRADVATSKATADDRRAEAEANLANAKVHVPGLPLLSLIEVEKVSSKAVCEAGRNPEASANALGAVTVLGREVTLSVGGPTKVEVPKVGTVTMELSGTQITSATAAAAALRLKVSVNPLDLNVAQVDGEIVLAEAHCESPKAPGPGPSAKPDVKPQAAAPGTTATTAGTGTTGTTGATQADLAETGGGFLTPYAVGGGVLLLGAGAGALVVARRGRAS